MPLRICIDCATIYDCNGCEPICPQCGKPLGLQREEPDNAATLSELTSRFLDHRPTRRGWATGGVVRPERRDEQVPKMQDREMIAK